MGTKSKKSAKRPAKKSAKPRRRFEGRQAMIPGVAPKKRKPAETYTAPGIDGAMREVTMPGQSAEEARHARRRPRGEARTYTARMELRLMPEQALAWDRVSRAASLTRAEWIRQVCDTAVGTAITASATERGK